MHNPTETVGTTLRQLRRARGWSLDVASTHTGVSKAMLGQIERGESSPTLSTLWRLVGGLGCSLSELLAPPAADLRETLHRRAADLRRHPARDGMLVAPLFPHDASLGFELLELTLPAGYERLSEAHATGVVEHVLVLEGRVELLVDGDWRAVAADDGLRFAADRPHGYRNAGTEPARCHNLIHYPALWPGPGSPPAGYG